MSYYMLGISLAFDPNVYCRDHTNVVFILSFVLFG